MPPVCFAPLFPEELYSVVQAVATYCFAVPAEQPSFESLPIKESTYCTLPLLQAYFCATFPPVLFNVTGVVNLVRRPGVAVFVDGTEPLPH